MTLDPNYCALITGGSDGIGLELAKCFASHGYRVVLVADNAEKLETAAAAVREVRDVPVDILAADLARRDGPRYVYAEMARQNIPVEVLVNNAGVGVYGSFDATDLAEELAMIELNVCSAVQLTKLFVNDMLKRQRGRILFTSSVAGLSGSPYLVTYGATKAFLYNFAMGLREELKDKHISVTALIPSETDTNFFRRARMEHSKVVQGELADPADVAKAGYEALMAGEAHVAAPFKAKMWHAASHFLPEALKAQFSKNQQQPVSQ